jgi:hypothetical protein
MRPSHLVAVIVVILSLIGVLGAGVASAAPANAPNAQTIVLSCAPNDFGINTATAIVTENNGSWSPGHVVAINGEPAKVTGIPVEFQGTVMDSSGAVVETFDQVKPGNRRGITNTLQCAWTETFTYDQGNSGAVTITVTLFMAPRS